MSECCKEIAKFEREGKCAAGVVVASGPCVRCSAADDDVCPAAAAHELRHSSPTAESLHKMLEVYWGKGDGHTPPDFITEAARLCGFSL